MSSPQPMHAARIALVDALRHQPFRFRRRYHSGGAVSSSSRSEIERPTDLQNTAALLTSIANCWRINPQVPTGCSGGS